MSRSVMIVDDHAGFRRSARALLEADGFDVVGEAEDGESAMTEAARLRPGLVLLDIQLPDLDGFELAARLISADYITNQGDIFGHGVLPNGDQRIFLLIRNPGEPLPTSHTRHRPASRTDSTPHQGDRPGTVAGPGHPSPCARVRTR